MKCEAVRIPGSNFEITANDATFRCVVCGLDVVAHDLGTTVMGPDFELRRHDSCIYVMKRGRAFRGTIVRDGRDGDRVRWADGNAPPGVEEWMIANHFSD